MRWRKIQCSLSHNASSRAICINGALYYLATGRDHASYIVCFDVQSENFKFIQAEFYNPRAGSLINYKGKIGVVSWPGHNPSGYYWGRNIGVSSLLMHELRIWVLEDVVKGAWSEYAYTLPGYKFWDTGFGVSNVCVVGVTATGEIVLSKEYYNVRFKFYVFYFHPERNTIQRVEIQGFENHDRVYAFVNHVYDLTLNIKPHRVQQDLLTFDMNYHQLQQHVPRFEKINKFAAPSLLEDE
ncbi:putative F-box protein At1g33020 [Brassica napus]|nr:putative F-box protein At1g33020 [Brassica napus]